MKLKKLLASSIAAMMAVSTMAVTSFADDTEYHAYLGVQASNWIFRNSFDDATYGLGTDAFNALYVTDPGEAIPATFTDVAITADGTYTVSVTDFDFRDAESFNLLFVSTDIPLSAGVTISDVNVKLDGSTKYTFDEAFADPDSKEYVKFLAINTWNDEVKDLFGYTMPTTSVEIEFTVSGLGGAAEAPAETTEEGTETTSPETGVEGVVAVAGIAVLAAGVAMVARKRK